MSRGLDYWMKLKTFHITQVQTYYPFKMSRGLDDWMKLKTLHSDEKVSGRSQFFKSNFDGFWPFCHKIVDP